MQVAHCAQPEGSSLLGISPQRLSWYVYPSESVGAWTVVLRRLASDTPSHVHLAKSHVAACAAVKAEANAHTATAMAEGWGAICCGAGRGPWGGARRGSTESGSPVISGLAHGRSP